MDIEIFKTLWGAAGDGARYPTFREAIPVISATGFDGVSFALISLDFEPEIGTVAELAELTDEHGLSVATMIHTFGGTARPKPPAAAVAKGRDQPACEGGRRGQRVCR